jgi:hypothetical protein
MSMFNRREEPPPAPEFLRTTTNSGRPPAPEWDEGQTEALGRLERGIAEIVHQAKPIPPPAPYSPVTAMAAIVLTSPYPHLRTIAVGLAERAGEKPPASFQDFVELLHGWAVGVTEGSPAGAHDV